MKKWNLENTMPESLQKLGELNRKRPGKPINGILRLILTASLLVAVLISSGVLIDANQEKDPTIRKVSNSLFKCSNTASLAYTVHLKPNIVYESPTLSSGQTYFTRLIDYIDTSASYDFSGDKSAEINGQYSATAYLEGENIPSKSFPIMLDVPEYSLTYEQKAGLSYTVALKPNSLYSATTLGPGNIYFSNIVDHLNINASYTFNGDKPSQSYGEYEVIALVNASPYWMKSYTVVPKTAFNANDGSSSISKSFDINLDKYQALAESINEQLNIGPRNIDLVIQFNVTLHAKTDEGLIHDVVAPSIVIPLTGSTFTIDDEKLSQQSSGAVQGAGTGLQQIQFNSSGKAASYGESLAINLAPYHEILDTIADQTGVSVKNPQLRIRFNVASTAETEDGTISHSLSPQMVIPLTGSIIEITGNLTDGRSGSLDETKTITEPPPSKHTGSPLASVIIFSILFAGFVAFTRNKPRVVKRIPQIEKEITSIRKKYGDHMVEAAYQPPLEGENIIAMASMEDLDKMADELGKLIIHSTTDKAKAPHAYYFFDGQTRYQYLLIDQEQGVEIPI